MSTGKLIALFIFVIAISFVWKSDLENPFSFSKNNSPLTVVGTQWCQKNAPEKYQLGYIFVDDYTAKIMQANKQIGDDVSYAIEDDIIVITHSCGVHKLKPKGDLLVRLDGNSRFEFEERE